MNPVSRLFLVIAGLILLTGVQLGALGAHALDDVLTARQLKAWNLGVQYQLVHGLGLILIAILLDRQPGTKLLQAAGWLLVIGTVLFSGGIYLGGLGVSELATKVPPYGGSAFMLAWLLLAITAWRWGKRSL